MLVGNLIIFISLILLFLYGGTQLYIKIENSEYKFIFWGLYFVTFLTVLEIVFCFYMYATYRGKQGEIGPRGFQGEPGNDGDKGKCDQNKCKKDLLVIMIKNVIEKYYEDNNIKENNNNNIKKLTNNELSVINDYIKDENNNSRIDKINQSNIKKFHEQLVDYISIIGRDLTIDPTNIKTMVELITGNL